MLTKIQYSIIPSIKHSKSEVPILTITYKNPFSSSWRIFPKWHPFAQCSLSIASKRITWLTGSSVNGDRKSFPPDDGSFQGPRLGRAIQFFQSKIITRIGELRNGFPLKLFSFLVGFYCATAFATVIGQTGDWDVLSAAAAVVVVEGIGALMYRASNSLVEKMRNLISIFNYWKAGLTLGLFLDAFKYELDNPFVLELDMFSFIL